MTANSHIDKGSEWRKWDLHFHTQTSYDYKDKGVTDQEIIDILVSKEIAVVAITDHHIIDTVRIRNLQKLGAGKITILPGIEFRAELGGSESIHFIGIFSETSDIEDIWIKLQSGCGITNADIIKKGSDNNIHCDFKDTCNLIHSLGGLITVHAGDKTNTLENITNSLPYKMALKTDLVLNYIDILELGKEEDQNDYNDKVFPAIKYRLPMIICSDNHEIKKYEVKQNLWIKADPTFEGLKQILYEPNYRVKISEQKPREPIRKIESIKFNFPTGTYIELNNSNDKQEFCLNQLRNEIFFSPYFTCLIGGRGTGKSTIINLLGERLGEKTDFFKENNLITEGKKYDIEADTNNLVSVSGTNEIEFVSQGKIERLAEGNELTKLIFNERIKEVESVFYDLDSEIDSIIVIINETIKLLFDLQKTNLTLKEKNKEKGTTQNIIDSVNDDRYKEITNRINDIRKEINSINTSQTRYENLLNSIRILLVENNQVVTQNDIETRINEILSLLKSIDEVVIQENEVSTKQKEFEVSKERIDVLTKEFVDENQKLKEFFQEKGMSEETIKDSQKANENLARINSEVIKLTVKSDRSKEIIKENSEKIDGLTELYDSYYQLIDTSLTQINRKLEVNNENVLNINFKFEFNSEKFKQIVFEEFYNTFSGFHISGTSANQVKEVLYLIEPNADLLNYDHKTFLARLISEIELKGFRRVNNYVKIITDIFANNINFIIYKLILRKHLYNLSSFIKIKGYYGDRELQNCSFGQRCTAVIVTLLMTGVKPLVIDEPEAHLDNRLVADYLVDLIKSKKLDRQIIFATHNSNFVINGDSELIHILDIPLNNIFTNMTSTSIENIDNREKLLKLEGGRDAFLTREQKYGIHN
jgi:exonuclease SbcC